MSDLAATPILANAALAAASARFTWAMKNEIGNITVHPCKGVEHNETNSRERVLSDAEIPIFWREFDLAGTEGAALKMILLLGQRPGETVRMHSSHLVDGWWSMPGEIDNEIGWLGTKNAASHRVWISEPVREIIAARGATEGMVLRGPLGGILDLEGAMRDICARLRKQKVKVERTTPHDLRRTCGTTIVRLTGSEEAMDRILNHKEGAKKKKKSVTHVYNRYKFEVEDKKIMEDVARLVMTLADGPRTDNVVAFG
jgi:integrase